MKRFLALLLAMLLSVSAFSQICVNADESEFEYSKTGITYTVSGISYFQAKLEEDYNGVKKGKEFWIDTKDNVVTDATILKKLNALYQFNVLNPFLKDDYFQSVLTVCKESNDTFILALIKTKRDLGLWELAGVGLSLLPDLYTGETVSLKDVGMSVAESSISEVDELIRVCTLVCTLEVLANNADASIKSAQAILNKELTEYDDLYKLCANTASTKAYAATISHYVNEELLDYSKKGNVFEKLYNLLSNFAKGIKDDAEHIINLLIQPKQTFIEDIKNAIETVEDMVIAFTTFDDYVEEIDNYSHEQYKANFIDLGWSDLTTAMALAATTDDGYSIGIYTPSDYIGLNIRSGASTSNSIVGAIAQGTNFTVTDVSGIWGYTTCNGVSGWVCLDYATKVTASGNTNGDLFSHSTEYKNSQYYTALKNVVLTGDGATDIVNIALSQLGYHEGNSTADLGGNNTAGYNEYTEYNKNIWNKNGSDWYWCATFVSWCARYAKISTGIIPNFAGCTTAYNTLLTNAGGVKHTRSSGYIPRKGDLIFFNWGDNIGCDHIGIVTENSNGSTVSFIDGNNGNDNVGTRSFSLNNTYIVGYITPNYDGTAFVVSKLSAPKITSSATFTCKENAILSWELDGADCYGITVVNDQTNAIVFDGDISKSYLDLGKLSAGKYRWQVRGYNGAGWGGLTDLTYFTVEGSSDTVTGEFYSSWEDLPLDKSDTYYKYYFDSTVNPYFPNNAPYSPNYPNEYGKDSDNEYVYGNCTWYCWSRASEILVQNGKSPLSKTQLLSNPAGWFSCAGGLRIDRSANAQPKTNSIAVYQIGNEEHVRYIDYADENTVIYSESGYRDTNDIDQDLNIVDPFNGGVPTWLCFKSGTATKSSGKWVDNGPWKYGFTVGTNGLLGYIYLDVGENVTPPTVEKLVSTASKSTYTTDENVVIDWNSFAGATSYGLTVTKKTGSSWTSRDIVYDKNGLIGTSVNLGKFDIGEYRFNMGAYDSDGTLLGQYSELSYFTVKTTTASDDFEWSEWSDWSTEKPAESDLVEVESKTQYGYYHYILQYSDGKCGAYPIDSTTFNSIFPSYPTTQKDYHTKYFDTQLSKTETLTYDKAYDCYINNCCPDAYDYDNGSNASYFYYLETRTVYRSRTKITNTIPVTEVFLNKSSVSLNVGDTETLVAAIMPSDATNRAVTWSSSDPSVAKVRNGVITALSAGTTEITVATEDGNKISTCTVNVTPSVSSIKAVMSSATASHGDTVVLTVTLEGAPLTDALGFKLELPEGITLAEGENTCWKIEGYVMDINISKLQGVWGGTEDADLNGEVLSLEFKVEETAASGANEINFEFYPNDEESSKTSEAAVESAGVIYVCDHDYGDLWISDGIQHWHECAICGERSDVDVHNMEQGVCTECGKVFYVIGDVDGKEGVYASDAIYLLYNIFFGEDKYPVNQNCDFDGNGEVEAADAIYLLYHVFFSEEYPLN